MADTIFVQIQESLMKGRAPEVKELVSKALAEGASPEQVLNKGLVAGMSVIGERFKRNEVYVPEVLIAARAMHAGKARPVSAARIQPGSTRANGKPDRR